MGKRLAQPENSVDTDDESGQEEEDSSSGASDSEPELPLTQATKIQLSKKPSSSAPAVAEPASRSTRVSSSEDSESESESEPDSAPAPAPAAGIKPIATKSMDDLKPPAAAATPTKKPRSKSAGSGPATPNTAGAKRSVSAADVETKESKRPVKKTKTEVENSSQKSLTEDPKKLLFQRLWSEDDEIAVLKGMLEYAEEKNADPVADLNAFHDFIRKSLHIEATRSQLQDKIRRLRKKYANNASKEKIGKERTFSKTHEQTGYELSKKIWGAHKPPNGTVLQDANSLKTSNNSRKERILSSIKGTPSAATTEVDHVLDVVKEAIESNVEGPRSLNMAGGSLFAMSLNELAEWIEMNKSGVSEQKQSELDEKWKALREAEVELYLKKVKLIHEQGKLVLDLMK